MNKTSGVMKAGKKLAPLAERLKKLGLVRDWDFVLHLPLRYEDETSVTKISDLQVGVDAQVEGIVTHAQQNHFKGSFEAYINDGSDDLKLRYLHYFPSLIEVLKVGKKVRLYGTPKVAWRGEGLEMIHPKTRNVKADAELPKSLTPIYPAGEGITQPWLRKRIQRALLDVQIVDLLNDAERAELNLMPLQKAIESLHYPAPNANVAALQNKTDPAWQRLKFDELLAQQITLKLSRKKRDEQKGPKLAFPKESETSVFWRFFRSLPFELTQAQKRVLKEIIRSIAKEHPMNRLVQGDVGSGKTIIAALSAAIAIDNGYQAVLMAPTEILAEQHFKKIIDWLTPLGIKVVWLAGKQKAKERRQALSEIEGGASLVVGTHALIQQGVTFKKLGLAIVDEQHRFGVNQRLALRQEGEEKALPHLLMLSATPIPRTLAMSYLADLDVSVIDELPPGRKPISTKLVSFNRKGELINAVGRSIRAGAQAYWVCPLIEESEKIDLTAATETFEQITSMLKDIPAELLHGKMEAEQKEQIMARFVRGETKLLVSTTVIEVGVDVPMATIMVIEHAERFGLAQLHQLRGRVGRGQDQSFCMALYGEAVSQVGRERLNIFRQTNDGFEIARKDLEIRGPGEFLGSRQSGVPLLRFANIEEDQLLVEKARNLAQSWIDNEDPRAQGHSKRWFESKEKFLEA